MFSLSDVLAKRALVSADPLAIGWLKFAGAAVVSLPILMLQPLPLLWPFAGYLLLVIPVELVAVYLYHRAIAGSPLSLTVPMLAFTPVFLLVIGFLMLGEAPTPMGYLGVALVSVGAYVVHLQWGMGIGQPFRSLWREPGVRMMLAVAGLYSITASMGKLLVQASSPLFFGAFYPLILTLVLAPVMLAGGAGQRILSLRATPWLVLAGIALTYAAMMQFHFAALEQAPVAYMIAVKRVSLLFALLWGRVFFQEAVTGYRVLGSVLMFGGVIAISLAR